MVGVLIDFNIIFEFASFHRKLKVIFEKNAKNSTILAVVSSTLLKKAITYVFFFCCRKRNM